MAYKNQGNNIVRDSAIYKKIYAHKQNKKQRSGLFRYAKLADQLLFTILDNVGFPKMVHEYCLNFYHSFIA